MRIADPLPPLGVMIEIPGAALTADALANVSDFFAIGSNDLTMYTLAVIYQPRAVTASHERYLASIVEIVEQGGDSAGVVLVHYHLRPLRRGLHIQVQNAAFDTRQRVWAH